MSQMIYIIMGVSGCGKTTIGSLLAKELNISFYDGDSFHPLENINKMTSGKPLSDSDRELWLDRLKSLICTHLEQNESIVLACSALKQSYRDHLSASTKNIRFIYLKGEYQLIADRMTLRKNHYMKPSMLNSQFDTLEEPTDAIIIGISDTPDLIVKKILIFISIDKNQQNNVR
jgi:gluconokinase